MAELAKPWRTAFGCLMTLGIAVYAISDCGTADNPREGAIGDPGDADEFRITSLSDGEVNPGDAVVVSFAGADRATPIEAELGNQPAEILVREANAVVVRIRDTSPTGRTSLRLGQGDMHSKPWDLHVRATNHRKLIARLLGGLALFVFGLALLGRGLRGLAGDRLRALLVRLTGSPVRAVGVGALVGAGTQLTSSAAAFTVSLVEARMLAAAPAVAVLVGAHLGASITGALLPVHLARESLLIIAVGVLWTRIVQSRRGSALASLVLSTGLMLYGLHLLQTSVEPLVSDPKLLPYVGYLRSTQAVSTLTCVATGAALAFLLQGPGPVYALVLGLAQTTTALPVANALAILAGTNIGAALGIAIIAWQAGGRARPLAKTQLLFGAAATVIVLVLTPLWSRFVGDDPLAYGHNVVRSGIAGPLAFGFATSQLAAVSIWLVVLPRLVKHAAQHRVPTVAPVSPEGVARAARSDLAAVLERLRHALAIALATSCSGERARSAESETALDDARRRLETRYGSLAGASVTSEVEQSARPIVAGMQLQRAVEQAVHVAELGVERGIQLGDEAKQRLSAMHAIAAESFDAVLAALEEGTTPDLEDASAREIQLNALEAQGREVTALRGKRAHQTATTQLGIAELIDSYENVGNHLFRLAKALAEDTDDV